MHRLNKPALLLMAALVAAMLPAKALGREQLRLDEIPKQVMDGLKAKFPQASINKWTKEKEGEIVIYDFEFTQGGQPFEADVRENGSIHNWEKSIPAEDLPAAVNQAVAQKFPQAVMKEIMQITAVKDGQDELEGYEIVLRTAEGEEVEVTLAPDGTILEDSRDEA